MDLANYEMTNKLLMSTGVGWGWRGSAPCTKLQTSHKKNSCSSSSESNDLVRLQEAAGGEGGAASMQAGNHKGMHSLSPATLPSRALECTLVLEAKVGCIWAKKLLWVVFLEEYL